MANKAKSKATKTAKRGPTTSQLAERMDGIEGALGQIAQAVGAAKDVGGDKPAAIVSDGASEPQPTRTVKLPELKLFRDEKRGIGQDATYPSNIALFKLTSDGSPVAKKDGALKKPTRMRVEDARFILNHADEVGALCDQIEASTAQPSA